MKAPGRFADILATLYKRPGCGLCDKMLILTRTNQKANRFQLQEIDIMKPENKSWKDCYEYDVPVLHVQKYLPVENTSDKKVLSEAMKLWHTWTDDELEEVIKQVQGDQGKVGHSNAKDTAKASSAGADEGK